MPVPFRPMAGVMPPKRQCKEAAMACSRLAARATAAVAVVA